MTDTVKGLIKITFYKTKKSSIEKQHPKNNFHRRDRRIEKR